MSHALIERPVILDHLALRAPIPKLVKARLRYGGTLPAKWQAQSTGYWCGPTSAQIALSARGVSVSQAQLAREMRTTENGTDYIGLITPVLNKHLGPDTKYFSRYNPNSAQLWADVTTSIDAGYAVVANIVAYTWNHPPGYPN